MNVSEEIIFRNATEDDVKYITSLAYAEMNKYLERAYSGEFNWAKWESEIREIIYDQNHSTSLQLSFKDSQFSKALILEISDHKIGFIWFSFYSTDIIWLDSIVLDPLYQSKGYGKQIFKHLFQIFKNEFKFLDLGVQEDNKRAIDFYTQLGFYKIQDITMDYYITNHMRMDL